jgi:hypothetical protein
VVATAENDTLACAGASVVQANDVYAQATIGSTTPSLGSFDIARVGAPSTTNPAPLRAIVHRVASPTTNVCSPPANTDGCTTLSANRAFGTIAIGGLPSGLGTPTGWSGGFARIENYADSATVSVGTNAPYPTTSASTPAGQLRVYDSASGTYESFDLNSSLTGVTRSYSRTVNVSGKDVTATFTLDGSLASNSSALKTSTPTSTGTLTRTEAAAQVVAPIIVVRYELSIATVGTVMDLTVTINLGTIDMDASYQPQPTEGS